MGRYPPTSLRISDEREHDDMWGSLTRLAVEFERRHCAAHDKAHAGRKTGGAARSPTDGKRKDRCLGQSDQEPDRRRFCWRDNRSIPKARGRQRETARQNRGGSHGKEETPPLEVAKSEEVTSLGTLDRRVTVGTCRQTAPISLALCLEPSRGAPTLLSI